MGKQKETIIQYKIKDKLSYFDYLFINFEN